MSDPRLRSINNEVVVDVQAMVSSLHQVIEGFFYQPNTRRQDMQQVIDAHRAFLAEYPHLSEAQQPPLLLLDVSRQGGRLPFTLVSG